MDYFRHFFKYIQCRYNNYYSRDPRILYLSCKNSLESIVTTRKDILTKTLECISPVNLGEYVYRLIAQFAVHSKFNELFYMNMSSFVVYNIPLNLITFKYENEYKFNIVSFSLEMRYERSIDLVYIVRIEYKFGKTIFLIRGDNIILDGVIILKGSVVSGDSGRFTIIIS